MIKVKQFVFNPFAINTYVIWDSETREALVVDPGMLSMTEREQFDRYIADNNLTLKLIINTHLHLDHCVGNHYLAERYGVPTAASADDEFLARAIDQQATMFGVPIDEYVKTPDIERPLHQGDKIKVGGIELDVLAVPGHSPGGLAFYCPAGDFVIVGDSLFRGAIGRTDLPGGDHSTLVNNVRSKLLTLPPDTRVLPGHEGFTTVRAEKASNPYLI